MKLGKAAMEALQAEVTGRLSAGEELVAVGAAALRGTVLLTENKWNDLNRIFSGGFLYGARNLQRDYGVTECRQQAASCEVWKLAEQAGATALYAMGEGGILAALWKMAEASSVGLDADLRKIPIRQETIEICEIYDLNPYKMLSDGAVLFGIAGGEALVQELRRRGYPAAVIGQTNKSNDRRLFSGESFRYLERPAADELYKIMEMIPED